MEDLFSLASGLVAHDDINCYKAISVGDQSVQNVEDDITKFGSLKLKRSSMAKIMSLRTSTVKVGKDVIDVDTTAIPENIVHCSFSL